MGIWERAYKGEDFYGVIVEVLAVLAWRCEHHVDKVLACFVRVAFLAMLLENGFEEGVGAFCRFSHGSLGREQACHRTENGEEIREEDISHPPEHRVEHFLEFAGFLLVGEILSKVPAQRPVINDSGAAILNDYEAPL